MAFVRPCTIVATLVLCIDSIWLAVAKTKLSDILCRAQSQDIPLRLLHSGAKCGYKARRSQMSHRNATQPFTDYFYEHAMTEFHGRLANADGPFLDLLLSSKGSFETFVDVGAGWYRFESGNQDAESSFAFSVAQKTLCKDGIRVYAFEPNPITHRHTHFYMLRHPLKYKCVSLYKKAVSNGITKVWLALANQNSAVVGSPREFATDRDQKRMLVNTTTVSAFAEEQGIEQIDVIKIDTEGHEMNVVYGMAEHLSLGKTSVIIMEVSSDMNADAFFIAHMGGQPCRDIRVMAPPTLLDFVRYFDVHGYDGFFIGSKRLIPLTCQWWRDEYEIGNTDSESVFGSWFWADAAFFRRGDPALRELLISQGLDFSLTS